MTTPLPKKLSYFMYVSFVMMMIAPVLGPWLWLSVLPSIEGAIAPVVRPMEITEVEAVGRNKSRIYGEIVKLRQCDYQAIEFYVGRPGAASQVKFSFEEPSQARPRGEFDIGPWLIHLTPDQLIDDSFAVVYHRCHPFWLTRTLLYP